MELPHIGIHCSFKNCNKLDFLPFVCDGCGLTFCLDHKTQESHECELLLRKSPIISHYSGEKSYPCSIEGCDKRELAPIECHHCLRSFCLKHRVQEDHNCIKLPPKKPEISNTTQHIKRLQEERKSVPVVKRSLKNPKQIKMAAKVRLMKMKGVAAGDQGIPQSERLFFQVLLPKSTNKPGLPMFFSKVWTVGRVIDKIADKAGIINTNNDGSSMKLRLFHGDSGLVLPCGAPLGELVQQEDLMLVQGGVLVLEMVQDGTELLEGLEGYR